MKELLKSVRIRINELQSKGSSVDKAARYLNAEFEGCFFANKRTLMGIISDGGKPTTVELGQFAR